MIKRRVGMAMLMARALASVSLVAGVGFSQAPTMAYAQSRYDLPAPYVSRALDAVLIPINHASRHRYQIPPKLRGVYVLAVAPHGVAARQGIRPGDVLSTIANRPIAQPLDVDSLVWAALAISTTNFLFGVSRGSDVVQVNTNITVNNFSQNINITNISNWTSVDSRSEWTQIVNQYDDSISTSINQHDYREGVPEPGQNFDGTNRLNDGAVPEPGQNFDGTNRLNDDAVPEPGQNFDGTNRLNDGAADDVYDADGDDAGDDGDYDADGDDDAGDDGDYDADGDDAGDDGDYDADGDDDAGDDGDYDADGDDDAGDDGDYDADGDDAGDDGDYDADGDDAGDDDGGSYDDGGAGDCDPEVDPACY